MKRTHVLAVMVAVMLGGCGGERAGRYQMDVVNGAVVRLDTATGEIVVYQNTSSGLLMETTLKAGATGLPTGR